MATPTADSYTVASGATVYGGPSPSGLSLGQHTLRADRHTESVSPMSVTLNTQASGSSFVAFQLGNLVDITGNPTDNKGNTLAELDNSTYYARKWSDFGLRAHAKVNGTGGTSHQFNLIKTSNPTWESDLAVIEVLGATQVKDHSIVARQNVGANGSYTSGTVTVTGPALLLCCWTGDGDIAPDTSASVTSSGWTMVDSYFPATAAIQVAVAAKQVGAGTHSVTWFSALDQGCILSLVALQ